MNWRDRDTAATGHRASAHDLSRSLVVIAPESLRGESFALDKGELTIGRFEASDICIGDPYVSRRHAVLRIDDRDVIIADAGSSAGTSVNGVRITGPRRLRGGDRLQLGRVELTFSDDFDSASLPGARTMAWQHTPPPARRFDLHDQNAAVISNVAGNQYNEHALRIEPMRRRARTVMRTGFTLVFAGLAAYIVGGAVFASAILNFLKSVGKSQTPTPHVPVAGWAIAAIGSASIVVGIFVIIASLFMRRGVRRQEERL